MESDTSRSLQSITKEVIPLSSTLAPFIKWGNYHSKDKDNPDVLELQIAEAETFETAYSVNVRVYHNDNGEWIEKVLPLKSHESVNASLLKEWEKNEKKGLVQKNKHFKLETCLDTSKNGRPIRRFRLIF